MTDYPHELLADALYAIRQDVGSLTRDGEADTGKYTYKYTSLPALVEKVDPIAWAHGVMIRHQLNGEDLTHELWFNGERVEVYNIVLPNPQGTAQGLGSAITYMRRYDITSTLGLVVDLDDDGAAASRPAPQPTVPREPPVRPAEPLAARAEAIAAQHAPEALPEDF